MFWRSKVGFGTQYTDDIIAWDNLFVSLSPYEAVGYLSLSASACYYYIYNYCLLVSVRIDVYFSFFLFFFYLTVFHYTNPFSTQTYTCLDIIAGSFLEQQFGKMLNLKCL